MSGSAAEHNNGHSMNFEKKQFSLKKFDLLFTFQVFAPRKPSGFSTRGRQMCPKQSCTLLNSILGLHYPNMRNLESPNKYFDCILFAIPMCDLYFS